jgi:RNA polymerase sigma-70 factor (ECF subfamily)
MTPACFRDSVETHHGRVHSYAAWLLGDVEEARDVAQEAFLRLWQHHERVVREAARTWLLRTAHRIVIDRAQRRSPRFTDLATVLAACPDAGPVDGAIAREERLVVVRALSRLGRRDRALLLLREQHRLPLADIGRVLDMPVGSVKAALHRARARLAEAMPADEHDPAPLASEVLA